MKHVEISPSNHGTKPLTSFSSSDLDARLVKALQKQNITVPTPIQAHGIPLIQKGFDVMGSAQTGTGKTLMFGLPLCQQLLKQKTQGPLQQPTALIINPTRELAMQTATALERLLHNTPLKVALATGGESVGKQQRSLETCDIVVGTPGRVLQFADQRKLSLKGMKHVVIDEADRMLDLGFEPDLRRIARALARDERRTVLCSATFPPTVQRMAADFLKQNYYFIAAGRVGATHKDITQTLQWVDGGPADKRRAAVQQVETFLKSNTKSVIVFCNTKDEAERVGAALNGVSIRVVTGDKQQSERNKSLEAFRRGKVQVLVATDVAARGLDVGGIGLVVQVDAPRDVDTFVHRVGRTGRAGAKGNAVAMLDGRSVGIAPSLVELMYEANQQVPAWLLGMSYVARARELEEEGAIAAGGGGIQNVKSDSSAVDNANDDTFSAQDFRSSAEAGSWGSERDTSYHSFEEEAYSSLDHVSVSNGEKIPNLVTLNAEDDTVFGADGIMEEPLSVPDDASTEQTLAKANDDPTHTLFERQNPSTELRSALKSISGTDKIGSKPNRKVLNALSKRGGNQRLRFEYLGMFPFHNVAEMLMSKGAQSVGRINGNEMPRVLMVAEKPSIAQAIADALSGPRGPRTKRGISRALPVFEFTSDSFLPSKAKDGKATKCLVTVTSVVGHVFSLGFVQEDRDRAYKDPSEYFRLPVVKQEEGSTGKLRVIDHLRALSSEADHLVLWLDCDAEGENIAHEVIGVTRRALEQKTAEEISANPDVQPMRRVHRARFSAITGDALRDAFGDLVEPDAALSRSVDARQELDLRVGVALTRLLTWRCVGLARKNFSAATKFISYGPCQTPTLSFCVDRAREIEAFITQDYWRVKVAAILPNTNDVVKLQWIPPAGSEVTNNVSRQRKKGGGETSNVEKSASFDQMAVERVVKLASESKAYVSITGVDNISEQIKPPLGLNTVALLSAGSKAMQMSPKKVMQVAEKLYSGGFISYPRTETTRYDPKGFDVRRMLREHSSHPEWGRTASHLLRTKYANTGRPPLRGHDAGDHPPITCLKAATRDEIGGGAEWRVYEFVARNFLGSLSDELKFTRRVARIQLDADPKQKFEVEKVQVDSLGFAGACPWVLRDIGAEQKSKGERSYSQVFEKDMKLKIANASSELCATKPPRFLQEHELIELMDTNRIGTDASMAVHVNNIVERGYVVLCDETGVLLRPPRPQRPGQRQLPRQIGRYLVPTPLGIGVADLFDKTARESAGPDDESPALLSRPAIRAQMEQEVKQIAMGERDKSECVEENLAWFEARYNELVASFSQQRLSEFSKSLLPTKDSLRYWQRLGAFEPPQQPSQHESQSKGTFHRRGRSEGRPKKNDKKSWNGDNRKHYGKPKSRRKLVATQSS
jgi:DNA topoisomerase-3